MPSLVNTTVEELPESRVRVQVEVPPEEVRKRVEQAARKLGHGMRVPGFRAGKAPAEVIISRIGREAVLDETVRESLGHWYTEAIDEAQVVPVGEPDIDVSDLPEEGESLKFSIEIGVRPKAKLGDYKGLKVGKADPEVEPAEVDGVIDRMRERMAKLEASETAAEEGNVLLVDYTGTLDGEVVEQGDVKDQLIELGKEQVVPGFDEQIVGVKAGEHRSVNVSIPSAPGDEAAEEKKLVLEVTVKEIKVKVLPEITEEFAEESGFDSVEELRADIQEKIAGNLTEKIDREYREAVLDAAVANAKVTVPDALIEARSAELWEQMARSLARQGISKETYMQISGKTEEEILDDLKDEGETELKRDAVLAAVVEAEKIQPTDDDLLETIKQALPPQPAGKKPNPKNDPEKILKKLSKQTHRFEAFKADIAQRKAIELLVDSARPVPLDKAKTRDKLWVPGKSKDK